jgi:hypothetical protein
MAKCGKKTVRFKTALKSEVPIAFREVNPMSKVDRIDWATLRDYYARRLESEGSPLKWAEDFAGPGTGFMTFATRDLPSFDGNWNYGAWDRTRVPDRTEIIPVELSEDPDNLSQVIDALMLTCAQARGPSQVIIWFNASEEFLEEASPTFEWWAEELLESGIFTPDFRLRVVESLRKPDDNFNNIRSDYMDVMVQDSVLRGFPPLHKLTWIDANTPFIARNAIGDMEEALAKRKGHFVKGNLQLTSDDNYQEFFAREKSEAEWVAVVYSITRRALEWNLDPEVWNLDTECPYGYVEEPGLAMTLEAYVKSGGVATTIPWLGESRTLLQRANNTLDRSIPLVYYVKPARIGKTYRRFLWMAERYPAPVLANSQEGKDYESFTTQVLADTPLRPAGSVTRRELRKMVRLMVETHYARSGKGLTYRQAKRIFKIIYARIAGQVTLAA